MFCFFQYILQHFPKNHILHVGMVAILKTILQELFVSFSKPLKSSGGII